MKGSPMNADRQQGNGMAISGFICALLSVIGFWAPGVNFVLWVLGIVFSIVGLKNCKNKGAPHRGLAMAGLVIALVPTTILILVFIFLIAAA